MSTKVVRRGGPRRGRRRRRSRCGRQTPAKPSTKSAFPPRGQPDPSSTSSRRSLSRCGDPERRLARGAADRPRVLPFGERHRPASYVVDQERGGVQSVTQQHLQRLCVGRGRSGPRSALVALVGGGQVAAMLRPVQRSRAGRRTGSPTDAGGRRQVPVRPASPSSKAFSARLSPTSAKPHTGTHRASPRPAGEDTPAVGHRVAEHRVRDVVRGQAEAVDLQQRLPAPSARASRNPRVRVSSDVLAVDEEVRHARA